MTNSYNDIHKSKAIFLIGGNPAEAHPVSLLHILKAKEENAAPLIVCDPRFTRTAAHADEYVRFRPGTDVALVWGILWHIFENGWEDEEFIRTRVWGMDQIRDEVANWTPEEVERVTGAPGASSSASRARWPRTSPAPSSGAWAARSTPTATTTPAPIACSSWPWATWAPKAAAPTSSAATATCRARPIWACWPTRCRAITVWRTGPGRTGRASGTRTRLARGEFAVIRRELRRHQPMMNQTGIPVSRWIDGVLEDAENLDQPAETRAMVFWGHAPNSQTRMKEMKTAMEKLDLLVVVDPFPTLAAVMQDREDGVYLLPASTQFETRGSVTASNRSIQWRDKVVEPLFESLPDHVILAKFAKKFGFADRMFRNIEMETASP